LHYANPGIYGNGSPHHQLSPSSPSIPTHAELEKHFMDLSKEKSRLEEMLARTEWLMQGVCRGMDEMREREQEDDEATEEQDLTYVLTFCRFIRHLTRLPHSPTCSMAMRRQWQAFRRFLGLGVFRAQ
jgi:hypothetical protein